VEKAAAQEMNRCCQMCAGTGQLCRFKGRSRFLLSYEDCPACCGTGYIDATEMPQGDDAETFEQDAAVPPDETGDPGPSPA
jgi:hypothetical protein